MIGPNTIGVNYAKSRRENYGTNATEFAEWWRNLLKKDEAHAVFSEQISEHD
jgi:hypothetical protein